MNELELPTQPTSWQWRWEVRGSGRRLVAWSLEKALEVEGSWERQRGEHKAFLGPKEHDDLKTPTTSIDIQE